MKQRTEHLEQCVAPTSVWENTRTIRTVISLSLCQTLATKQCNSSLKILKQKPTMISSTSTVAIRQWWWQVREEETMKQVDPSWCWPHELFYCVTLTSDSQSLISYLCSLCTLPSNYFALQSLFTYTLTRVKDCLSFPSHLSFLSFVSMIVMIVVCKSIKCLVAKRWLLRLVLHHLCLALLQ